MQGFYNKLLKSERLAGGIADSRRDFSFMGSRHTDAVQKQSYEKKDWIDVCVSCMFIFYVVSYVAPVLLYYNRYISALFSLFFILLYSYKAKKGEVNYSYFLEFCPTVLHLFSLYTLISAGWALDPHLSLMKFLRLERDVILLTFFYAYFRDQKDGIQNVQNLIEWSGLAIVFIVVFFVGVDRIQNSVETAQRMTTINNDDNVLCNVNQLLVYLLIQLTFSLVSLIDKGFRLKSLVIVPSIFLLFWTGSRQAVFGIILVAVSIFLLSLIKYKKVKQLLFLLLVFLLLLAIFNFFVSIGVLDVVSERLEQMERMSDHSTKARLEMVRLGWEIFFTFPLVGCGIGCPQVINLEVIGNSYLHNEYMEILAGGGVIGFLLYFSQFLAIGCTTPTSLLGKNKLPTHIAIAYVTIFLLLLLIKFSGVLYYDTVVTFFSLPMYLSYGLLRSSHSTNDAQKSNFIQESQYMRDVDGIKERRTSLGIRTSVPIYFNFARVVKPKFSVALRQNVKLRLLHRIMPKRYQERIIRNGVNSLPKIGFLVKESQKKTFR